MYKVYILLCRDNSFYVGYTDNIKRRIAQHNNKTGSFYLSSKLPMKLVWLESYDTKKEAMDKELQLKGWTRIKKINLIKFGHPTKINH
jgi:predicted GIY-YIG superfamily endonuclease